MPVGKVTKASVAEYAKEAEITPYPIEGIPEGFSWFREKMLTVDSTTVIGYLFAFIPLSDWKVDALVMKPIYHSQGRTEDEVNEVTKKAEEDLLNEYKKHGGK